MNKDSNTKKIKIWISDLYYFSERDSVNEISMLMNAHKPAFLLHVRSFLEYEFLCLQRLTEGMSNDNGVWKMGQRDFFAKSVKTLTPIMERLVYMSKIYSFVFPVVHWE